MSMLFSEVVIGLLAVYLIGLGILALARADIAASFLLAHARSARAHYLELLLRFTCAWALLTSSPQLLAPSLTRIMGWVILITSAVLVALPWRLHARFAQSAVPQATRHMKVIGFASILGGLLLAFALLFGPQVAPGELIRNASEALGAH